MAAATGADTMASLDDLASQPMQNESVTEAVAGLFPPLDVAAAAAIGVFLQEQGASDRISVLLALRAQGGAAVLRRAGAPEGGLNLVQLGILEALVTMANPPASDSFPDQEPGVWHRAPWLPSPAAQAAAGGMPTQEDPNSPADFGILRPYLDSAEIGDPTRNGIPTKGIMTSAIQAAGQHSIPYTEKIPPGKLPKEWVDRPLAHWLDDAVRHFWAEGIVGAAGVGDCFNRLTHVASIAKDIRYPAATAERAAVRYDAFRCHGVCLDALKARRGEEVRACFREACEQFDAGAADRLLAEEAASLSQTTAAGHPGRPQRPGASTGAPESLRSGLAGGAQICLLWGLGACTKAESVCGKLHMCPYCGSKEKGCLVKNPNHANTLKRHTGTAPEWGRGRGRPYERTERRRSRSRSRRDNTGAGAHSQQRAHGSGPHTRLKTERSPSAR